MNQGNNNHLIQPEDFSRTVENVMHVFTHGHTEKLPDLLQDAGNLLVKASKRMSTTQLILAVAAVAVVTVFVASKMDIDDFGEHKQAA